MGEVNETEMANWARTFMAQDNADRAGREADRAGREADRAGVWIRWGIVVVIALVGIFAGYVISNATGLTAVADRLTAVETGQEALTTGQEALTDAVQELTVTIRNGSSAEVPN